MAEHYELTVLADYLHTGVQAANTKATPTPRGVGGELERNEVAEAVFMEVFPPVTGAGDAEVLKQIVPVLDGESFAPYVSISGIRDCLMTPPKQRVWGSKLYSFGSPMNNNGALSTTLKYSREITLETLAGGSQIDNNYRVRIWGYKYKEDALSRIFGTMQFPSQFAIDRARNRVLRIGKREIPVNGNSWTSLPGGKDQAMPKINPLIRYAWNNAATDGKSGDYEFRYTTGNVLEREEDLYFDFDEKDALLIEGLGVRATSHLSQTAIRISGDHHPKGFFPTTYDNNPIHFGHCYPVFPADLPMFYVIPKLERPLLVWGEKGIVVVRDDGNAIGAANLGVEPPTGIVVALTGTRIEMEK